MNYSFNSRVRYSETGENGKLTLPGVFELFSGLLYISCGVGRAWRRRAEGKRQSVGSFFLAGNCG